jgi:hypothetical protein
MNILASRSYQEEKEHKLYESDPLFQTFYLLAKAKDKDAFDLELERAKTNTLAFPKALSNTSLPIDELFGGYILHKLAFEGDNESVDFLINSYQANVLPALQSRGMTT